MQHKHIYSHFVFPLLAFILSALPAKAYDFTVDGIYYNILDADAKTVEVTCELNPDEDTFYTQGNEPIGELVLPSTVEFGGVVYMTSTIGKSAFYSCRGLVSVTIPNSVTSIGSDAFSCTGITSIAIPNSVTSIGSGAFSCTGITSITIPNSVTSIESCVFDHCGKLTDVTIPNSITSIGWRAFSWCDELLNITIPTSVRLIDELAFIGCSKLESVTIPNSVTSIGSNAFKYCSGLTNIEIFSNSSCAASCFSNSFVKKPKIKINQNFTPDTCLTNYINLNLCKIDKMTCNELHLFLNDDITFVDEGGKIVNPTISTYYWATRDGNKIIFKDLVSRNYSDSDISVNIGKYNYKCHTYKFEVSFNIVSTLYDAVTIEINWPTKNDDPDVCSYRIGKYGSNIQSDKIVLNWDQYKKFDYATSSELDYYAPRAIIYGKEYIMKDDIFPFYSISNKFNSVEFENLDFNATSEKSARILGEVNLQDGTPVVVEWRRIDAPDLVKSNEAGCTVVNQKVLGELRNLKSDVYYKFRLRYDVQPGQPSTMVNGYFYSSWEGIFTGDADVFFEPEITTMAVDASTESITLTGYAIAGTEQITSRGFEYRPADGISTLSTNSEQWQRHEVSSTYMQATLTDLMPGTNYLCRAYVDTADGKTYYGDEMSFTTIGTTGIEEVIVDGRSLGEIDSNSPCEVYTINGTLVNKSIDNLTPGFYIVRQGFVVKKIVVK